MTNYRHFQIITPTFFRGFENPAAFWMMWLICGFWHQHIWPHHIRSMKLISLMNWRKGCSSAMAAAQSIFSIFFRRFVLMDSMRSVQQILSKQPLRGQTHIRLEFREKPSPKVAICKKQLVLKCERGCWQVAKKIYKHRKNLLEFFFKPCSQPDPQFNVHVVTQLTPCHKNLGGGFMS